MPARIPPYAAPPLAKTFLILHTISILTLLSTVGLAAHIVASDLSTGDSVDGLTTGVLAISSISTLYTLLTIPFFYAHAHTGLLVMSLLDAALALAYTVLSVLLGETLGSLACVDLRRQSEGLSTAAAQAQSVWQLENALDPGFGATGVRKWAEGSRERCYEAKGVWGLCVVCAGLGIAGAVVGVGLWVKERRRGRGKG